MENTHKSTPTFKVLDGQKFDFNMVWSNFMATFMPAWELLKKDPMNFILVFAMPIVLASVLALIVVPMAFGSLALGSPIAFGIITLVFILLAILLKFFAYGCALRAIVDKEKTGKIDIGAIIGYVRKNIVGAVKLAWNVFIYTQAWIPMAVGLAGLILAALGQIALAGLAFLVFPIVMIIIVVLNYGKMIRSSMAMLYFFESENPQPEDALKASLAMGEGKTWTLFYNYLMIGLAVGIASGIAASILTPLFRPVTSEAMGFAQDITAAVFGSFSVIFQYTMKWQAEKLDGAKK